MIQKNHTKTLIVSSMIAALIFVITYFVKIYLSTFGIGMVGNPYINLGDSMIYSAGLLIGAPWAAAAAAIGSALADLVVGAPTYILGTFIVKGLMGFTCAVIMKNAKLPRFIFACVIGGAIMVAGYGLYEWIVFDWAYAIGAVPFNLIQWVAGVVGAVALYYPIKRIKGTLQ